MTTTKNNTTKFPTPGPWVQTKKGPRKLYAAFGSNLHVKAMRTRCPDAYPARGKDGRIKHWLLDNARLVFRGVADLDWCPGSRVPVGLWWISERDEKALDRYEGYPHLYEKFHIWLDPKKKTRQAMIYLMLDRDGVYPPSAFYAGVIRDGYRNFDLDESYLDDAIKHAFNDKNPSEQTTARRARQRKHSQHYKLVPMPYEIQEARMEAALKRAEEERRRLALREEMVDESAAQESNVEVKELEL